MIPNTPVVCLVEDDPAVRNALAFCLEVDGMTVRGHDGAASLLRESALASCGCLIVDYRMPEMDGLELVRVLRARGIKIPVIMITGRATKALRAQAEKLGIHDVIEKPLPDGGLLTAIRAAIADARRS